MSRWWGDLVLGCRLALRRGQGSGDGWARLAMTAVGVGLGVAVLLLASSVPGMLQARADRADGRDIPRAEAPTAKPARGVDPLLVVGNLSRFRDLQITGYRVQPQGPNPPRAPGVSRLPGPGEIVLSPALATLLTGPDKELLRPRFPERVIGTIGPQGLIGPNELAFYAGAADLAGSADAVTVSEFGSTAATPQRPPAPYLPLLVSLGAASLLIPVVIFLASTTRLASQARDRRLAAIRLVGGGTAQVRRIAAGEVFVGAVAGLGVGVGLFLIGRSLVTRLTSPVFGNGFYVADIRPVPLLAALILLSVPVLAVGLTLFSLRPTLIEPLSVVRRVPRTRRRLWWRLVPLLAGGGVLTYQIQYATDFERRGIGSGAIAGIVLVLAGVAILMPWLIERTAHALGGSGTPAWQLAIRRLQYDTASSARIVGGVATAVAGGIALQSLFIPAEDLFVKENPEYTNRISVDAKVAGPDEAGELGEALRDIDGVRLLSPVVSSLELMEMRGYRFENLYVAPCPTLRRIAHLSRCADGDAYRMVPPKGEAASAPGDHLRSGDPVQISMSARSEPVWAVPNRLPIVVSRDGDPYVEGILATPGAMAGARITEYTVYVDLVAAPSHPDAVEHIRNAAAPTHWSTIVSQPTQYRTDQRYALIRSGLFLGSLVVLILAALSLLVVALEQLRERRRPLAMLAAGGVRRSVLAWSLLWQAAIPTVLALAVALAVGLGMARLLLQAADRAPVYDWPGIAVLGSAGLIAVLVSTALTLPALFRTTAASGLRTE